MLILALDSSLGPGRVGVIDVAAEPARTLAERCDPDPKGMAERLVSLVGAVLADAGLTLSAINRIAVTTGPGGFTSLRIALAAAQGLSLSQAIPLVGVPTLGVLAQGSPNHADLVLAAIPVGRGEIAVQAFAQGQALTSAPWVGPPQDYAALLPKTSYVVCGPAGDELIFSGAEAIFTAGPQMMALALLAARLTPGSIDAAYQPLYARAPDAKLPEGPQPMDHSLSSVPVVS